MNYCTSCGAELGLGRFCTSCGAPVSRPDAPPPPPPIPPARPLPEGTRQHPIVAPDAGYGSRFPLYADEEGNRTPLVAHAAAEATAPGGLRGARRNNTPWVVVLILAMLAAGVTGFWLATRDPGSGSTAGDDRRTASPSGPSEETDRTDTAEETETSGEEGDLARGSRVEGPDPMPAGQDLSGNPVTFTATNMLDANARTAYRVPGDATGSVIRFELPQEGTITEVGLINGYAKTDSRGDRTVEWYAKNRRILQVEWRFDDGTTVVQDLAESSEIQTEQIPAEVSGTVELRILKVSPPGRGALGKNVTAISDVLLLGT